MGRILVVDDDAVITTLVAHVLRNAGHDVVTLPGPEEAVQQAVVGRVDLAVLDVMMPGGDGLSLLRQFRSHPELAEKPVLMLSARHTPRDRVQGLREGADDYLGKPFDIEELVLRVDHLLGRRADAGGAPGHCAGPDGPSGFGRYEVKEVLGRGAMGTVFKAWDPTLQRWVALKTISSELTPFKVVGEQAVPALILEAVHAAQLSHPNVVAVYDAAASEHGAFIAMEYIHGMSLAELGVGHLRLPAAAVLALAWSVTSALDNAHGKGIVHRDVKPGNVLLGFDGAVKLGDFGLAGTVSSLVSANRQVFGAPGFIAPEVLRRGPPSAQSDLFALGVMLYWCVTGELPFRGSTIRDLVGSTLRAQVPPVDAPDFPAPLRRLIEALLQREPEDRPGSAHEVLSRLALVGTGHWDPRVLEQAPSRSETELPPLNSTVVRLA